MTEGIAIETSVRIEATPEEIFPYLVDPELMSRWMGSEVDLDPTAGGIYRVKISEGSIARGEFNDVQPNRSVTFTFGWEGEESTPQAGETMVRITLEPLGEGTEVRLRHIGLTQAQAGPHTEGWEHYLARLAKAAVGEDPGEDPHEKSEQM
jgi:uncharacterized protein YndB with AHSA1/START domain